MQRVYADLSKVVGFEWYGGSVVLSGERIFEGLVWRGLKARPMLLDFLEERVED